MEEEKKLKILMLEDSEHDVILIERILRKENLSFEHKCVDTRDEFNEAISRFQPDVILSDHGLPGFNSREALKVCVKERPSTPFILVTGTVSEEYAISCLRDGADDYILKTNLSRLPTAIRNALKKRRLEKLKREARLALRKQNDELIKVNKELDSFVYSVSHNLRGPLASLLGLINIAKEETKEPKVQEINVLMERTMLKLDETLKEIVDYSKNARSEIRSGEINWPVVIEQSLSKLEYLKGSDSVTKNIRLLTDIPFVTDGSRLEIIFNNILSNSIIYRNKNREATIDLEVITTEESASITIRDNGIGIREDAVPKVFDMFFRGSEISQGAGLGLYIVKEVVNKLQGDISISSAPGIETTIVITLPQLANTQV